MKCPTCKKTIPDDALKCPYCNGRTGLTCKKCGTVNPIFNLKCKNCSNEILKQCPNCKGVNYPDAEKCRKCGYIFTEQSVEEPVLEYHPNLISQMSAKNILVKGILSKDKKIFSLSGEKGVGKSIVLKTIMQELKDFSLLYGKCTPITQLTSGGLIQDILLNVFNLPNFCLNDTHFKKDAFKFFKNEFENFDNSEITELVNFLYPEKEGTFENIFSNKNKTFTLLYKIFDTITSERKFIIAVDNFDFIDGFSYEFLSRYAKNIWNDLKLLLIYNEPKPAKGYFYFPSSDNIYLDVGIAPLEFKQINTLLNQKKKTEGFPELSTRELQEIYTIAQGNPSYISHALNLCFDCIICGEEFELCKTFDELLEYRLTLLSKINPEAYEILLASAIIGDKININLMQEIFALDRNAFMEIMIYLKKSGYINAVNELYCEFSSLLLWETILKTSKNIPVYKDINEKIFNYLRNFTLNANSIFGIIAQNLKLPDIALHIWTKNTKLACYIGDVNLYAISQKQCLALINEFDETDTLKIRYNISERLGKLLANSNPIEAMEYLPDAISNAEAIGDSPKEVELLSYMASCCRKTGQYFGEVECVDNVLRKVNPENKLEIALLKTSKLNALLNIGNCGQIVNMVDTEIMPVLDEYLSKRQKTSYSPEFLYETWLKTYLILANALVLQGNDRSFEILTILFDIIERNHIEDELFICKCKLVLAFADTMKGNFKESEKMLEEILKLYRENVMDNETILKWNFVNIINNFFKKRYSGMQEDLFQIVTFANNNGDNFTKNILKTLLGKIFKDSGNSKQAIEIYNEQITYFAKEKMALGALLTWFLIADATLDTEGAKNAMEIAEQALEVAKNPKIDNYFFTVLLKTVIAKCCITLSDFETAKMNIESAIMIAKKFSMKDILSRLYILYGKYFQELGLVKSPMQNEYLTGAEKMYEQASVLIHETYNKSVYTELHKARKSLETFCCINNIKPEKL